MGSFYLRFRNKEAFFKFLIESISETLQADLHANLTSESVKELTLAQTVRHCVDHYVETNRQYESIIRAAVQYSINDSDDWQPMRDNGLKLHDHYIDLILGKSRKANPEEARQQLRVGLQIISGHLVNSITHPINRLPLHDPNLSHWLFEVLMHCLKVKPPAPVMPQQKKGRLRTASRPFKTLMESAPYSLALGTLAGGCPAALELFSSMAHHIGAKARKRNCGRPARPAFPRVFGRFLSAGQERAALLPARASAPVSGTCG